MKNEPKTQNMSQGDENSIHDRIGHMRPGGQGWRVINSSNYVAGDKRREDSKTSGRNGKEERSSMNHNRAPGRKVRIYEHFRARVRKKQGKIKQV